MSLCPQPSKTSSREQPVRTGSSLAVLPLTQNIPCSHSRLYTCGGYSKYYIPCCVQPIVPPTNPTHSSQWDCAVSQMLGSQLCHHIIVFTYKIPSKKTGTLPSPECLADAAIPGKGQVLNLFSDLQIMLSFLPKTPFTLGRPGRRW